MITVEDFFEVLRQNEVDFFTGVPDSLLKDFCSFVDDTVPQEKHCIAVNEGAAVGIASGYHLATNKVPLVYMQNSGLGNAVNPLTSLADEEVYGLPMLLLIGWRGEPGTVDEPQHVKMGRITIPLLEAMNIPFTVLPKEHNEVNAALSGLFKSIQGRKCPHAIVVPRDTFSTYQKQKNGDSIYTLSRENALEVVVNELDAEDIVVSTTGKLSRELFELRERRGETNERDFLTVGSMGHASQIALGIALANKNRKIFCFDGDGAALMHLGGWSTIGEEAPKNFIHIIFNNGAHESVGGQPTAGFFVNFQMVAEACKYKRVYIATSKIEIENSMRNADSVGGPVLLEIRVKNGARKDLGRPTKTPGKNKEEFERHIRN